MKRILLTLSFAALALSGCIQDEVIDNGGGSEAAAIDFGTYLGRSAQTRATVITSETLKGEGFGVNAWYTGLESFDPSSLAGYDVFMNNTRVAHDGTSWSYSPLKYWPNNPNEMVSFVAYAPYNMVTAGDGSVSEHPNIKVNGTAVTYTVANEVKDQVDLLWSDSNESEDYSTIDLKKQTVDDKVTFYFKHALSKISFKVGALIDMVDDDTTDGTLGSEVLAPETVIKVRKVVLMGGDDTYEDTEGWLIAGGPFHTGGTLSLMDGTWSELTAGQRFEFTAEDHFIVNAENEFVLDESNSNSLNDLLNDESYLMIIPQDLTADGFKIYIEYDVITNDSAASDGSVVVANRITSADAITSINFEQGKQYNINMILGMTTVKFDVVVEDWVDGDPADTDEDLPANKDGESGEGDGSEELFAGAGTPEDPFKIYTAEQLLKVSQLVNSGNSTYQSASYIQMNDIDLSTVCSPTIGTDGTAVNWFPIGRNVSFEGVYDGGGYSVSNLYFFSESEGRCGLFYQNKGTVRNVTVTECDITAAESFVGAVVGYNDGGTVVNCHSDNGVLRSSDQYLGGVVGMSSGVVIACSNTSTVNCTSSYMSSTGGIVGVSENNVLACFNSGSVSGMHTGVAGVVGLIGAENVNILSCYNTGTVTNSNSSSYYATGSIVGRNYNNNAGFKLESSYHADESNGTSSDDTSIEVNGSTVSWENAMASMNNAIAEWNEVEGNVQVEYRYAINSDPATSATQPLILVKQ